MAIVRWGSLDTHGYESELYVIELADGSGYRCLGCKLNQPRPGTRVPPDTDCADGYAMNDHLIEHAHAGHVFPELVHYRLGERLAGYRVPDPVIEELVALARQAPDGEGIVVSDDIDVPDDVRMTLDQVLALRADRGGDDGPG